MIDMNTTLPTTFNTTMGTSDEWQYPQYAGFICCGIAALLFGTNFIPVKKFETGNGVFFQWVLTNGILLVGYVIHCIRQSEVHPFVMIGGAIFGTGHMLVVPVVKAIGLGLGICIWASTMLVIAWINARFGLIGIEAQHPRNNALNYAGVGLSLISAVLYAFVQTSLKPIEDPEVKSNTIPITEVDKFMNSEKNDGKIPNNKPAEYSSNRQENHAVPEATIATASVIEGWPPLKKKIFGIGLGSVAGLLFAFMFIPATYVQQTFPGASQNSLDYVFSQYCGTHLASTFYLVVYIIYTGNMPALYPRVILPGLISGVMWGTATAMWFIANRTLSEAVSFPIISTLPQGISVIIGIIVFKEIKGTRNIVLVGVALTFTLCGAVCAGLSK